MRLVAAENVEAEHAATQWIDQQIDGLPDVDAADPNRQPEQLFPKNGGHAFIVSSQLRAETALTTRRLHLDPDIVHPRAGRPAAAPRYQRVDGLRLTLEHGAHRAVGVVAHPAGDVSRACATNDGVPKADALNLAADRHTHLLSRRRSPPDRRAERTGTERSG